MQSSYCFRISQICKKMVQNISKDHVNNKAIEYVLTDKEQHAMKMILFHFHLVYMFITEFVIDTFLLYFQISAKGS